MKRTRLLNSEISEVISRMGHTDLLCIGECTLPIPEDTQRIDVSIERGIPSIVQVLEAVLSELEVEEITVAEEAEKANPDFFNYISEKFSSVRINTVMHAQLKLMCSSCKAVIRTGESSPFADIILHSGSLFKEK